MNWLVVLGEPHPDSATLIVKMDDGMSFYVFDFDKNEWKDHGVKEKYYSPPLKTGRLYEYLIKAERKRKGKIPGVRRVMKIHVHAREIVRINLSSDD